MEFPNTNIVRNVPRLPNSSAICWGGQSIWTHPYWPQLAHSHQQHSRTWAQLKGFSCSSAIPSSTWGMPFRDQLEECHVLNPYPELGTFRAQLKEHQQSQLWSITKSVVDHALRHLEPRLQQQNCLARDTCCQALLASDPGWWCVTPLKQSRCRFRLAGRPSPPGARVPVALCWAAIAWRSYPCCQASQASNPLCFEVFAQWNLARHQATY